MIRIFKVLVPASVLTLLLSEILLIFGCYFAVWYFESDGDLFLFSSSGWQPIAAVETVILLGFYFRHLYRDLRVPSRIVLLQQLSLVFGVTFIAQALMSYWTLDWAMPRSILIPGSALALTVVFLNRVLFSFAIRNHVGARRLLFVGFSPTVARLAKHLGRFPEFGFAPIGYLDRAGAEDYPDAGLPRLGSVATLPGIVDEFRPDWIVVGNQQEIQPGAVDDFLDLRFDGVHTARAATLYESTLGRVCAPEIRPAELIFSESLQPDRFSVNLQPFYSVGVALAASALMLPFIAVIAVLVKVSSQGNVLRRETRVGLKGIPFTLYQFRLTTADGRSTGIGTFLRHFRLDGLPQFWNVLRGEMSIVGPYPDRPEFAERLNQVIPFHAQRTAVKPGMTGWAQIHYFGDGSVDDAVRRLEYDLYYVRNLSPSLDFSVMIRWLREALRGFSAA